MRKTCWFARGWHDEGLAWYGVGPGEGAPVPQYQRPSGGVYPNLSVTPNLSINVSIAEQRVYVKSGSNVIYTLIASTGVNNATPEELFVSVLVAPSSTMRVGMGANYWVAFEPTNMYLFHSVPTNSTANTSSVKAIS